MAPTDTAPPETASAVPGLEALALHTDDIREYVAYRREQLRAPRLGGNPGGGAMIAAADEAQWLNHLERFANWLDGGKPAPSPALSEDQKTSFRAAKAAGATFPEAIERQL